MYTLFSVHKRNTIITQEKRERERERERERYLELTSRMFSGFKSVCVSLMRWQTTPINNVNDVLYICVLM